MVYLQHGALIDTCAFKTCLLYLGHYLIGGITTSSPLRDLSCLCGAFVVPLSESKDLYASMLITDLDSCMDGGDWWAIT